MDLNLLLEKDEGWACPPAIATTRRCRSPKRTPSRDRSGMDSGSWPPLFGEPRRAVHPTPIPRQRALGAPQDIRSMDREEDVAAAKACRVEPRLVELRAHGRARAPRMARFAPGRRCPARLTGKCRAAHVARMDHVAEPPPILALPAVMGSARRSFNAGA